MATTFPTDQTEITSTTADDTLLIADASDSNNAKKLKAAAMLAPQPDAGTGGRNFAVSTDTTLPSGVLGNAIASNVHTSVILSGYNTQIGQETHTNRTDDSTWNDSPQHSPAHHCIVAGYDSLVNGLASVCISQHARVYAASTHATIIGGAYNAITDGNYSVIVGGGGGSEANGNTVSGNNSGIVAGVLNNTTSNYAGTLGGNNVDISGDYAAAIGGLNNTISGQQGAAVGGTGATVSQANAVTLGGANLTASGSGAVAAGGSGGTASGTNSFVAGGAANSATATGSVTVGGQGTNVNSAASSIVMGRDCSASDEAYQAVFGYDAAGKTVSTLTLGSESIGAAGDAQTIRFTVRGQTSSATPVEINAGGGADTRLNRFGANYGVLRGRISVVAMNTANGQVTAWDGIEFVVKWTAAGALTISHDAATDSPATVQTLVNEIGLSVVPTISTGGAATGDFGLDVTGATSTTINWVANVTGVMTHA